MVVGYALRLALEPNIGAGLDVASDRRVEFVAEGSAADSAGVRVGDIVTPRSRAEWFAGAGVSRLEVERNGQTLAFALDARNPSLAERLTMLPWYRLVLLSVGLVLLGFGWWSIARNPDMLYAVPFALWTASAAVLYPSTGPSQVWQTTMWELYTVWDIVLGGLFQVFSLHWMLSFPRPLGGRRTLAWVYGLGGMVMGALLALAWMHGPASLEDSRAIIARSDGRAAVVALVVIVLAGVQLARASTRRTQRQAAWVFLAIGAYALIDLIIWELPSITNLPGLGTTATTNALVGLSYLVVPLGFAIAMTREGLFGIDRFVTPGLATAATTIVLILAYVLGATLLTRILGVPDGTLPMAAGVGLAAVLAVLVVPAQRRLYAVLDRVFNRQERQRRAVLADFEARVERTLEPVALRTALATSLREGLDLTACMVDPDHQLDGPAPGASRRIVARPGVLDLDTPTGVRLDEDLDVALHVSLPTGEALRLGARQSGARFSEDHLELVSDLARRYTRATERLALLRQLGERDLELANTRLRIAGDLHDDIGASLSSMAVLSDLVRRNEALPDSDRARLDRLSASARSLVDDLRDIVWAIDPKADRLHDLAERLRDTAAALLPGVRCTVTAPDDRDLQLDMETRRHLFLIAKEALHNIARHADASRVQVHLSDSAEGFALRIEDDGQGFDPEVSTTGHGLASLRERAAQVRGTLEIDSAPGRGTRLTLHIPSQNGAFAP